MNFVTGTTVCSGNKHFNKLFTENLDPSLGPDRQRFQVLKRSTSSTSGPGPRGRVFGTLKGIRRRSKTQTKE